MSWRSDSGAASRKSDEQIRAYEDDGTILGHHAVIDQEKAGNHNVSALIEVKLTPERKGGFDRIARRIARFDQVSSCYLMSGGYDLAVIVDGQDLREVALFVSEKLSSIEGVTSTATHFQLKVYKQSGFLADAEQGARAPAGRAVICRVIRFCQSLAISVDGP